MDNNKIINRIISKDRFSPYLEYHKHNSAKAIEHYKANIIISESFYPLISILEVGLRNSIHYQLCRKYKTTAWYDNLNFINIASDFQKRRIHDAKNNIEKDKKELTPGRIIAALSFGFWTSLFDSRFERTLWKNLRMAFPYCPKEIRQRKTISANLNKIRRFRNRLFHHEAITWDIDVVLSFKDDMIDTITWLEKDLQYWTSEFVRTDKVIADARKVIQFGEVVQSQGYP